MSSGPERAEPGAADARTAATGVAGGANTTHTTHTTPVTPNVPPMHAALGSLDGPDVGPDAGPGVGRDATEASEPDHAPAVSGARPHIVLVGMMGVGKTTVGRLLARRIGVRYVDADHEIVAAEGRSVAELFSALGEPGFRAIESDTFARLLGSHEPLVVAAGGGAVLAERNRALFAERATVVWLRATVTTILHRVGSGAGRPLLQADPRGSVERLHRLRTPIYTDAAELTLDVDRVTPGQVTDRLARLLGARGLLDRDGHWLGATPKGAQRTTATAAGAMAASPARRRRATWSTS